MLGVAIGRGIQRVVEVIAAATSAMDGRNPSVLNPPPGPPPKDYRP